MVVYGLRFFYGLPTGQNLVFQPQGKNRVETRELQPSALVNCTNLDQIRSIVVSSHNSLEIKLWKEASEASIQLGFEGICYPSSIRYIGGPPHLPKDPQMRSLCTWPMYQHRQAWVEMPSGSFFASWVGSSACEAQSGMGSASVQNRAAITNQG